MKHITGNWNGCICTLGIPFASNWTGVKILSYNPCATGIDELTDAQKPTINIFPNPANEQVTIQWNNGSPFGDVRSVFLMNTLGQKLKPEIISATNTELQISTLQFSEGVYSVVSGQHPVNERVKLIILRP